jgi:hypothetical protein
MDAQEFMRRAEEVRARIAETLTPEEVETAMQPLETFGAIMAENETEADRDPQ